MEETVPEVQQSLSQRPSSDHSEPSSVPQEGSLPTIASLPAIASLPDLPPSKSLNQTRHFTLLKSACSCSIHEITSLEGIPQENIYRTVHSLILDVISNPALLTDILTAFQMIDSQPLSKHSSINALPRRKPLKTSLNELALGQQKKRTSTGQDQENISIKLIRNGPSSRTKFTNFASLKESISIARLLPTFRERIVLQEVESVENLDSGPEVKGGSKGSSLEGQEDQRFKGISIVMDEGEREGREEDDWSQERVVSLGDLSLPTLKLSEHLIEEIIDCPSPFLATLALSLLFKFLQRSHFQAGVGQIGWLLGVSTLVAYKIFFDETIEGLVEYYSRVLTMQASQIRLLEQWFLAGLNYEVAISNRHYLQVMLRLIAHNAPK